MKNISLILSIIVVVLLMWLLQHYYSSLSHILSSFSLFLLS